MPVPSIRRQRFSMLLTLLLLAAPLTGLRAQSADSAAAVAVVERLLATISSRDSATARAILAPGSRFVSILSGNDAAMPRTQGDTAFLAFVASNTDRLLERIWSPVVLVRGPLATVWAPYDFHRNGARTHCGVDAFTLLRTAGAWRVTGITYTVERTGCADSPLGPPR